jgi:hypothetical protein
MAKRFPIIPAKPELICWGCDKYCPADAMACGNGSDRTQHPVELFGEDWMAFGLDAEKGDGPAEPAEPASPSPQVISLHHP